MGYPFFFSESKSHEFIEKVVTIVPELPNLIETVDLWHVFRDTGSGRVLPTKNS